MRYHNTNSLFKIIAVSLEKIRNTIDLDKENAGLAYLIFYFSRKTSMTMIATPRMINPSCFNEFDKVTSSP